MGSKCKYVKKDADLVVKKGEKLVNGFSTKMSPNRVLITHNNNNDTKKFNKSNKLNGDGNKGWYYFTCQILTGSTWILNFQYII